eukprot:CAMPEP_0201887658 /NCGR_PEP_ID=MMETSP0902-20130614/25512_1 /ASSEMBLY_ACC=CAM_ASM_000551 /TAXON_ID=420261 /ORGANISM="Thalassiosira antarctica, Strain CCMP982" /LENGTH=534 /DNA_ID=CAMNT_0048417665 /DNA_START=92 /DNA_END=1696 /DNA_ORIENTATION=+
MFLLSTSHNGNNNSIINMSTFSTTLAFVAHDHRPPLSLLQSRNNARLLCFTPTRTTTTIPTTCLHMSSIGGGNEDKNNNKKDDNPLNEWIQRKESENVRQVREQFSEGRLPISFGAMNMEDDEGKQSQQQTGEDNDSSDDGNTPTTMGQFGPLNTTQSTPSNDDAIDATSTSTTSSSLSRNNNKPNPYLGVVSRLTPSDLISKFTTSASPRVQDAVRTTVLGLIGGLPQMAFETKTVATGERLASLMFQLQMTGYMFKNAEYRSSMSSSLGSGGLSDGGRMLLGGSSGGDAKAYREGKGRLKGRIKVKYGGAKSSEDDADNNDDTNNDKEDDDDESNQKQRLVKGDRKTIKQPTSAFSTPGMEVEVDAQAYMSELRGEVSRLRDELDATKQAKEEEIRKDLLMYIRTLPQQELQQLTGTMSPEVLEAMKGLVTAVLAGISEDDNNEDAKKGGLENTIAGGSGSGTNVNKIGPDTVTEQSGEALAQLCMWQLVVGFNLRELEVREEFTASMKNMLGEGGGDGEGDAGGFGPGALE